MPTRGYGHMELLRLSPRTGEALRRLNVFQGQVLHGRVFKVEPVASSGSASPGAGFLAKIALGSQTIEAVMSKALPEGAAVKLEVLRLSEDSLVLRLLEAETGNQDRAPGPNSSRPDSADWSASVRESATKTPQDVTRATQATSPRRPLVQLTAPSALPEKAAHVLRTAVNEGFLDPGSLSARPQTARTAFHNAVEQFHSDVVKLANTVHQPETKELADSIIALTRLIRPVVAALPNKAAEIVQSAEMIARDLIEVSSVLRTTTPLEPEIAAPQQTPEQTPPIPPATSAQTSEIAEASSDAAAPRAPSGTSEPAQSIPQADSRATPPPAQADIQQTVGPNAKPPTPPESAPKPPAEELIAARDTPSSQARSDTVASERGETQASADSSPREPSHPARELLMGLRVLSALADRMARIGGWSTEQEATLARHSSRLATLADAWEGTLIAPLLTRSLDVPDAVPRLLLWLLFPGGSAEFAVLQPARQEYDRERHPDTADESRTEECIGVVRLHTDALGTVSARLDYHEDDGIGRIAGRFSSVSETARAIRSDLPALDRALEARGITPEGFRVLELGEGEIEKRPEPPDTAGLDIKV